MRTCETCEHGDLVAHPTWPAPQRRCMRTRTLRLGPPIKAEGVGVAVELETDSVPEPHRVAGDKCGPGRRHWKEKS